MTFDGFLIVCLSSRTSSHASFHARFTISNVDIKQRGVFDPNPGSEVFILTYRIRRVQERPVSDYLNRLSVTTDADLLR